MFPIAGQVYKVTGKIYAQSGCLSASTEAPAVFPFHIIFPSHPVLSVPSPRDRGILSCIVILYRIQYAKSKPFTWTVVSHWMEILRCEDAKSCFTDWLAFVSVITALLSLCIQLC